MISMFKKESWSCRDCSVCLTVFRYRLESCEVEGNRKVEVDGFLLKHPSVLFVYGIFFVLFYTFLLFLFRERGESYFCFRLLFLHIVFIFFVFYIFDILYNFIRDAPKWKFLAKAKPDKMKHLKAEYRTRFFKNVLPHVVGVDRLSAPILSILPIIDIGHFQNRFADHFFFFFFLIQTYYSQVTLFIGE